MRDCLRVCVWEGEKGKRKSEGRRRGRRGNKRVCRACLCLLRGYLGKEKEEQRKDGTIVKSNKRKRAKEGKKRNETKSLANFARRPASHFFTESSICAWLDVWWTACFPRRKTDGLTLHQKMISTRCAPLPMYTKHEPNPPKQMTKNALSYNNHALFHHPFISLPFHHTTRRRTSSRSRLVARPPAPLSQASALTYHASSTLQMSHSKPNALTSLSLI